MRCLVFILNSRTLSTEEQQILLQITQQLPYRDEHVARRGRSTVGLQRSFNLFSLFVFVFVINPYFVNIQCRLQWEKLRNINAFPVNINWTYVSFHTGVITWLIGEAAWPSGLWRWIWNLEVSGSNPPPCCYLDLFSVVPSSTPRPRCVNSQLVRLPPVGILNSLCSTWNILIYSAPINTTVLNT